MEKSDYLKNFNLFIIGTTASGKTKLSLSLAKKYNGEIISSDSMQLYKHADIMTAKATQEEQALVQHHMIDVLELDHTNFNRNDYFKMAQECIQKVFQNPNKINSFPVIVGGTHYYAETLLFNQNIQQQQQQPKQQQEISLQINEDQQQQQISSADKDLKQQEQNKKIEEIDQYMKTAKLEHKYARLQQIDPLLSNKLHPHDERRIDNYLRIALETGQPPSETMQDHQQGQLRNENCLIFWTRAKDFTALKKQQQKRIEEMANFEGICEIISIFDHFFEGDEHFEQKLNQKQAQNNEEEFDEVEDDMEVEEEKLNINDKAKKKTQKINQKQQQQQSKQEKLDQTIFTKGVLQSIGYKEFIPFYQLYRKHLHSNTQQQQQQQTEQQQQIIQNAQQQQLQNQTQMPQSITSSPQFHNFPESRKKIIEELIQSKEGYQTLKQCKQQLKIDTAQYSKRQLKWIKHRILINDNLEEIRKRLFVFEFDEFTSSDFDQKVVQPALIVLGRYLDHLQNQPTVQNALDQLNIEKDIQQFQVNQTEIEQAQSMHIKKGLKDWRNYVCEFCQKSVHGEQQWRAHLQSKNHKYNLKKSQKQKHDGGNSNQKEMKNNHQSTNQNEEEEEKKNEKNENTEKLIDDYEYDNSSEKSDNQECKDDAQETPPYKETIQQKQEQSSLQENAQK